ncbi:single-stranded DNA-binding protein [Mycoplasmopsis ciconiae]|uniref:Single-stranded DNA-binding protein n=1 Tax=Mycoplasmopsis ciconiae TaxID=561067 RepID=A0ABU7MKJ0_9BACT|nr:single-stranded DNA-binding protein [Mycoplasmopsis ciconiae]
MNKVFLIGRTTQEVRFTQLNNGVSLARVTLAVERDTQTEQTDFIPLVAWRNTALYLNNAVRRGTLIAVEGSLTSSTYKNKDNLLVTSYDVTIDRLRILEPKAVVDQRVPNPNSFTPTTPNFSKNNFNKEQPSSNNFTNPSQVNNKTNSSSNNSYNVVDLSAIKSDDDDDFSIIDRLSQQKSDIFGGMDEIDKE